MFVHVTKWLILQINDVEVLAVKRRGNVAIHYTAVPIDVGTDVSVVVDWSRRWDHMQQHSGEFK
jgi:misacylated tRNA(Ala) deacylase